MKYSTQNGIKKYKIMKGCFLLHQKIKNEMENEVKVKYSGYCKIKLD
jgi:hypothetical protein